MSSTAQDLTLAALLSSYIVPEAPTVTVKAARSAPKSPKAHKVSAPSVKVEETTTTGKMNSAPMVQTDPLPSPGTIDASSFMLAVRNAGKRKTPEGRPFFDKKEERGDMIRAIAGFIGYDPTANFGQQETAARATAMRETHPVIAGQDRTETKVLLASVKGFIHGTPDHKARTMANLKAREVLAADTMIDHEKSAETATTEQDKGMSFALAQVEKERLIQIRADIALLGG
jgi:hypothetical protein